MASHFCAQAAAYVFEQAFLAGPQMDKTDEFLWGIVVGQKTVFRFRKPSRQYFAVGMGTYGFQIEAYFGLA